MADNKCETCEYKLHPQGGHCYMFRTEPEFLCMQHQDRRGAEVRVGVALEAMALAMLKRDARNGNAAAQEKLKSLGGEQP